MKIKTVYINVASYFKILHVKKQSNEGFKMFVIFKVKIQSITLTKTKL